MKQSALHPLLLLAGLCSSNMAMSQEIKATSIGKLPPARTQGGGVQIDIYNRTQAEQQVEIREPGGNWYQFTIPAEGGINLRCEAVANHFEALLPGSVAGPQSLMPGAIYEVLMSSRTGQLTIAHRRR